MPFKIERNDITTMSADAIVNSANPEPVIGYGVDAGIHKKAGPRLLEARKKIGTIAPGQAAITDAYDLDARYVIHTVGPLWEDGSHQEEAILADCYRNCLNLALQYHCGSVVFPMISCGNQGFPKDKALQIAISEISRFLLEHDMSVTLAVFSDDSFKVSSKLMRDISSYIDETYINDKLREEYGFEEAVTSHKLYSALQFRKESLRRKEKAKFPDILSAPSIPDSVRSALNYTEKSFRDTLLELIDQSGKSDPEIYKKANISRQVFSRIRINPAYQPSKSTALAFAFALELDLNQTKDLLGRAGYTLSHSSKADIIAEYFLLHHIYDLFEVNETLFAFDQPLIGG